MPTYKNLSHAIKTFYGVTFLPNDTKRVPGYINDPNFIRVPQNKVVVKRPVTQSVSETIQEPVEESVPVEEERPPRKYRKRTTIKED